MDYSEIMITRQGDFICVQRREKDRYVINMSLCDRANLNYNGARLNFHNLLKNLQQTRT